MLLCSAGIGYAGLAHAETGPAGLQNLTACIDTVCLYEVVEGQEREWILKAGDLADGLALATSGYICGVVLVSSRAHLQAAIEAAGPSIPGNPPTFEPRPLAAERRSPGAPHCYAYFPNVRGDAVCPREQFRIAIGDGTQTFRLPVYHGGYREIAALDLNLPGQRRKLVFRLAGGHGEDLLQPGAGLHPRLEAVAKGIAFVEQALGAKLVEQVNILDYRGPDNALTQYGTPAIWFYADTLLHQTPAELQCMAEHETLHLFVDGQGYTASTLLREFFAELHGFGPLSLERFALVTTGRLTPSPPQQAHFRAGLLDFIDERNFITGMSGGHAADNLDEFATSFIHSLLYIDRLTANIQHLEWPPVSPGTAVVADSGPAVLQDYMHALKIFLTLSGDPPSKNRAATGPAAAFFVQCWNVASGIAPRPNLSTVVGP